jgi:hypothetical protein
MIKSPVLLAERLEKAREIARERGGKLLSENMPPNGDRLVWQCAQRHQWIAQLSQVKYGKWCAACARVARLTMEDMHELAAERTGKCLSKEYVNGRTPLLWQCADFHQWWAPPGSIRRTWCPVCAGTKKLEIGELRKLARERGGKLLSTEYVNVHAPLLWRCWAKHTWYAPADSVKPRGFRDGSWCPHCVRLLRRRPPASLSVEEMREIARERGGTCVSESYVNAHTKLRWRCAEGHEWDAVPSNVKNGTWCPACGGKQKLNLETLQAAAAERGGALISSEYVNSRLPLTWQCDRGHQWQASAAQIRYGAWCPHCSGRLPLSIDEMRELARAWGGACLSEKYVNSYTPLEWRCAHGHVWQATASTVKPAGHAKRGSWCPVCAKRPKHTIEDMRALAASRGGECLSEIYVDSATPLTWRCAEGHSWEAPPSRVLPHGPEKKGAWCQLCDFRARIKFTIEDMRKLAAERGGQCLSEEYISGKEPLRWRCARGHEWTAKPVQVRLARGQGSWCPACARQTAARKGS